MIAQTAQEKNGLAINQATQPHLQGSTTMTEIHCAAVNGKSTPFAAVPAELTSANRWVVWKYEHRNDGTGQLAKIPYSPKGGYRASTIKPGSWASFDAACAGSTGYNGIGYVLGEGIVGIDLDDCITDGTLSAQAQDILDAIPGYAEISPSGAGIKIITRCNALKSAMVDHKIGIEVYPGVRYFTITGNAIPSHLALPENDVDVATIMAKYFPEAHDGFAWGDDDDLKLPLNDWDADRISSDMLPYLDPDCGYTEWLEVGTALHHQFEGAFEGMELWDSWSQGSSKYVEGDCEYKWSSFNSNRSNVKTLATLVKKTKEPRQLSNVTSLIKGTRNADSGVNAQNFITSFVSKVKLSEPEINLAVGGLLVALKEKGVSMSASLIRKKLLRVTGAAQWPSVTNDGMPKETIENLAALCNDEGITVRYNVIGKNLVVNMPGVSTSMDNKDPVILAKMISLCTDVGMPTNRTGAFLLAIGDQNLYNPVAEWVTSREWDGVSRLNDWYATLVTDSSEFSDTLKHLIMRRWAIQAIAAAFEPNGVMARGVLVLQGDQYLGKTRWIRALAPQELGIVQTGKELHLSDKDSKIAAVETWVNELGELDSTFRKSDISALKAFLTQDIDKVRRPYAAAFSTYPRRTVFAASVNDEDFLADKTGNTRFWVIPVTAVRHEHQIDMQQVWAEVKTLYDAGEPWFLSQEEMVALEKSNEDFSVTHTVEEMLAVGLDWDSKSNTWSWKSSVMVLQELGLSIPGIKDKRLAGVFLNKHPQVKCKRVDGARMFLVPQKKVFV